LVAVLFESVTYPPQDPPTIEALHESICECRRCPRLVAWTQEVARTKVARFKDIEYWGKPVPSLGKVDARLLVVGLAPAAHGGTRTGRVFTGDRSGDWLYRALHRFGFVNQPHSVDRSDGLKLTDSYITAILHCAPPLNKPQPEEVANCKPFLARELELLGQVHVIVALGKIAFDNVWPLIAQPREKRPLFKHGLEVELGSGQTLIASYHPSQQNTFTGKLTEAMFDGVFARARQRLENHSRT
jgi:uracil-DNA glycosylase family 4